jgi:hypothetical protein
MHEINGNMKMPARTQDSKKGVVLSVFSEDRLSPVSVQPLI